LGIFVMMAGFHFWLANMGDHTVASWVSTGVLVVTGTFAWRQALRSSARSPERTLWASIGLLLLAIGLNKQLDLQILAIKELGAFFGRSPLWASRRLVAAVILGGLGIVVVRTFVTFARAVRFRAWPIEAAAGAAAALAGVALARGTTGAVNDMLVVNLHASAGNVWQLQVKDVVELFTASVIAVSCLSWRGRAGTMADGR
jgi:hypothetical protein